MKDQEFIDKQFEIRSHAQQQLKVLEEQYVRAMDTFEVGDIIATHYGSMIKVEELIAVSPNSFYNTHDTPIAAYRGTQLTKKLTPYKDADKLVFHEDSTRPLKLIKKGEQPNE